MSPYCKISHARRALSSPTEALLLGRQKVDSIGKEGIFPGSGMPAFTTGRRHGLLHPQPRRSHTAIAPQKWIRTLRQPSAPTWLQSPTPNPVWANTNQFLLNSATAVGEVRKLCFQSILGGVGERGLTAANPLTGFCFARAVPQPPRPVWEGGTQPPHPYTSI